MKPIRRFVNPSLLWPPISSAASSSVIESDESNNKIATNSNNSSTDPPSSSSEKTKLVSIRERKRQRRIAFQQQKQRSQITSFFDDYNASSSPRSELNPMRNHLFEDQSNNNNNNTAGLLVDPQQQSTSSLTNNDNDENSRTAAPIRLTKAQKQFQKRVQQQRIREEHRQKALFKEKQMRQRICRPGCNPDDNVPVREYTNGRVGRRTFNFANEKWCSVCNEPVESYVNHVGRKDHALLDQHFEGIVEYDRTWSAHEVLFGKTEDAVVKAAIRHLRSCTSNNRQQQQQEQSPHEKVVKPAPKENNGISHETIAISKRANKVKKMMKNARKFCSLRQNLPSMIMNNDDGEKSATTSRNVAADNTSSDTNNKSFSIIPVYEKIDELRSNFAIDERDRRSELFSLLKFLIDEGAIDHNNDRAIASKATMFGVFLGAHLALHYYIPSCTMNLFPAGAPDHMSNIEDFVSASYNMETAYDMCNFKKLPGLSEGHAAGEISVNGKSSVVRVMLSQLKPAILSNDEYVQEIEFARPENFFKEEDQLYGERFGAGGFLSGGGGGENYNNNEDGFGRDDDREEKTNTNTSTSTSSQHDDCNDDNDNDENQSYFNLEHKMNKTAAVETLMAISGRSLIAELVHCRISEYVVRAERPWVGVGQMEQLEPGSTATDGGCNPPLVRFDFSSRPEADSTPWRLKEKRV